ncbi:hypothetical protein K439DRAFT_147504 [Ramaria rubella]|nr:hypothetical protein K439DRAFT_147504 [Ramaria rubella]
MSNRTDSVIQNDRHSPSSLTNKEHDSSTEMETDPDGAGESHTLFSVTDLESALKHCKLMAYQVANSFRDDEIYEPNEAIRTAYHALGLLLEIPETPKQTWAPIPDLPFEGINALMHAPSNTPSPEVTASPN